MVSCEKSFFGRIFGFLRNKKNFEEDISSPDGKIVVKFSLKQGSVYYSVKKNGVVLLKNSKLGLKIKGEEPLDAGLSLVRMRKGSFDEVWETVWGEDRVVRNNFNERVFYLGETDGEKRLFTLKFRVFDDGVGFRYEIPPQPSFSRIAIEDELTEFAVDMDDFAWTIPANQPDRYEYNYEKKPIFELNEPVHTPLTIKTTEGYFLSIHEAALYDYGEMTLKVGEWKALKSDICPLSDGMKAYVELPFNTPWRVIMVADRAMDLVKNKIIYNLNPAPRKDFSFVKPLKFMGIWWEMYVGEKTWKQGERHGATTENALSYLKSCSRLGISGLLIEGWNNGWEGDWLQNGQYTDFTKATDDFNLDEMAGFAKKYKLELISHHETVGFVDNYEKQLEETYKFLHDKGIKYVKTGYAGSSMMVHGKRELHHSQVGVRHYQRTVEMAAKYGICLDIHEPIKGTGIERTWPNLLTREGARGQEYEGGAINPTHGATLPFTRLLSGGMDYTSGIFDITNGTKRIATTITRQLAYFVTIPSGMQMAADRPKFYENDYPELFKFIKDVPVNWEKTVPLMGEIGEYFVVARQGRGEKNWYIGGVVDMEAKKFRVRLDFLDDGDYKVEIYRDAENAHYRDNPLAYKIEKYTMNRNESLDIFVAPGGGFAIRLEKL